MKLRIGGLARTWEGRILATVSIHDSAWQVVEEKLEPHTRPDCVIPELKYLFHRVPRSNGDSVLVMFCVLSLNADDPRIDRVTPRIKLPCSGPTLTSVRRRRQRIGVGWDHNENRDIQLGSS